MSQTNPQPEIVHGPPMGPWALGFTVELNPISGPYADPNPPAPNLKKPFVSRVPDATTPTGRDTLARFTQIVSSCFNSLVGQGILKQTSPASWALTAPPVSLGTTLTALAATNWAANAFPIGTGPGTVVQTPFAANTFPARGSTGNLVAKPISDFGLAFLNAPQPADGAHAIGLGTADTASFAAISLNGGEFFYSAAVEPTATGDAGYIALKPGSRSYFVATWDALGGILFGRSDSANALVFVPSSGVVALRPLSGSLLLNSDGLVANPIVISSGDQGGVGIIQIGRRYSDSNAGVGASTQFWMCTGQTAPAITVLAPGGGSSVLDLMPDGSINSAIAKTAVNGSTSGTATFSQPMQGPSLKRVIIYCNILLGTASYTFPTAFTNTPSIVATNDVAAGIVTARSTTAITITGTTTTGFLELVGY